MRASLLVPLALLPLLAGCQMFAGDDTPQPRPLRLQGQLQAESGQLLLQPCVGRRQFVIDSAELGRDAEELLADGASSLFVDLAGVPSTDGERLSKVKVYRLQHEGPGCEDGEFKRQSLRASGNEPDWSISISRAGLLLQRPGEEPKALPYVEEVLPEGRLNFSSEANGERLELWLAPQRCQDSMSGALTHLSAELRLSGEILRGCAAYGGQRND